MLAKYLFSPAIFIDRQLLKIKSLWHASSYVRPLSASEGCWGGGGWCSWGVRTEAAAPCQETRPAGHRLGAWMRRRTGETGAELVSRRGERRASGVRCPKVPPKCLGPPENQNLWVSAGKKAWIPSCPRGGADPRRREDPRLFLF